MRNLLLHISYDGKPYHGWQIQQNALSVQQVFQTALHKVLGELPASMRTITVSASKRRTPSLVSGWLWR